MKKLLCTLSALLLAAAMTGCAESSNTAETNEIPNDLVEETLPEKDDPDAEEAETDTDADSTAAADSIAAAGNTPAAGKKQDVSADNSLDQDALDEKYAKEIAAARKVLEQFMDGMTGYDVDALFASSNLRDVMAVFYDDDYTEEELRAEADAIRAEQDETGVRETYEILELHYDTDALADYESGLSEFLAEEQSEDAEDWEEEDREIYEQTKSRLPEISAIVSAEVHIEEEDYDYNETYYIYCTDGKWIVDLDLISEMFSYADTGTDLAAYGANVSAKSFYCALNTSLVDMDADDIDIGKLAGKYVMKGSDFSDAERPQSAKTQEDMLQQLKFYVMQYFAEADTLDELAFIITEDGCCTVTAVRYKDEIGVYPISSDDEKSFDSLEAALEYGKKLYEN